MKLKEIKLGFENCDVITIEGKYVKGICLGDIQKSYEGFGDEIKKIKKIKNFAVYIDKNANKKSNTRSEYSGCDNSFERIYMGKDITSVTIKVEDIKKSKGSKIKQYDFGIVWVGEDSSQNPAQRTYISKEGALCLVISKRKQINNFFDILYDEEEKEEYIEFHL